MKHGVKFRVMSRLITIILTIFISFAAISYLSFYHIMQNNISKRGNDDAQKNLIQLRSAVEDVYQLAQILSLNDDIRSFITTENYRSSSELVVAVTRLMDKLENNILLKKYIHSFCIIDGQGRAYWSRCPYDDFFIDWFKRNAIKGDSPSEHIGFTQSYTFPSRTNFHNRVKLISCISNINHVVNGIPSVMGQIIVNLDLSTLMPDIFNTRSIFNQIGIIDKDQQIIFLSGGDEKQFLQKAALLKSNFEKINDNYYFLNQISTCKWKVISIFSKNKLKQMMDFPFLFMDIIIISATLGLIFIYVLPLLINLSRQIETLDRAMGIVAQGNLDVAVSLSGSRELDNISNGFNRMVCKTKEYMKEALDNLEAKQRVSFELLLAKINPHFIYNTLNSVIYLARKNKHQEIIDLTSAFIFLLQDSIHLEENSLFATVATEVEVIEKYVLIQKYRYADRFVFKSCCDPQLSGTYIPKNILQPLIENAIIHGICPKKSIGHIHLNIQRENDNVRISITDDGVGMSQTEADCLLNLDSAKESACKPSKMRPIGIRNIAEKLHFVYPSRNQFSITSRPGKGVNIIIVFPIKSDIYIDNIQNL
jgi:two-component system sensor histidine kinase YesM